MLVELSTGNKVVGVKQIRKALAAGRVKKVFVAEDADPRITAPIFSQCGEDVPIEYVPTMKELGRSCGIEVGATAAALLL